MSSGSKFFQQAQQSGMPKVQLCGWLMLLLMMAYTSFAQEVSLAEAALTENVEAETGLEQVVTDEQQLDQPQSEEFKLNPSTIKPEPFDDPKLIKKDMACWHAFVKEHFVRAGYRCRKMAAKGGPRSMYVWGQFLQARGKYEEAAGLFRASRKAGFYEAFAAEGEMYARGLLGEKDECKAKALFTLGEFKENLSSAKLLVISLLLGYCTSPEIDKAWALIHKYRIPIDGRLQNALALGYTTDGQEVKGYAWTKIADDTGVIELATASLLEQASIELREEGELERQKILETPSINISQRMNIVWFREKEYLKK